MRSGKALTLHASSFTLMVWFHVQFDKINAEKYNEAFTLFCLILLSLQYWFHVQ